LRGRETNSVANEIRKQREGGGVLTREDVGDGEDAERPPDGAQLGLLDQILDALHPLRHLGLHARARRGAAWPVGGGGGAPVRSSRVRNPPPQRAPPPSSEKKAGPGGAGGDSSPRRFLFLGLFCLFGQFSLKICIKTCPGRTSLVLLWGPR
jgi:hypothetical protein